MSSPNTYNNTNNNDIVITQPPWQVLALVSYHLDPKTLAISSCVSKSWYSCFSSDHLWAPLCLSQFPSLSALPTTLPVSRHRLFAIGYAAARLRTCQPRRPDLSLDSLLFAITITIPISKPCMGSGPVSNTGPRARLNNDNRHVISVVRPCKELKRDPQGTFRFDVDVEDDMEWSNDELEGIKVTWNVMDKDWKAVFGMAEESGVKKGGFATCADGWFSEELPTPWCCSGGMSSGLVADLRVEMKTVRGGGVRMKVEKVKVGVMCILNWRYLSVDDALSYLDHFLKV